MLFRSTAIVLLVLTLSIAGLAQIKSGVIKGTVIDQGGALVLGANVTVTNIDTNVSSATITNESGSYTVPYLTPGNYTVTVEKAGFSKYSKTNIGISTAQTVSVEIQLQAGVATEAVTVNADAATLQTTNATVQGLINERVIDALPNITHNPFSYAGMQAGVISRGAMNDTQNTASFGIGIDGRRTASAVGINGGAAFSNDIQLDGVSIQGSAWNETAVLPNQDALQEVRTITNNYSAEYGRAQGVVIFTTKSGGNNYHGSAFYRNRNEALNANSFSNNADNISRGPFKSNSFGGTVGGRIIKDKAFFFVSYEGLRFNRSYDYFRTVPTQLERNGDFSQTYVDVNGKATPIILFDPFGVPTKDDKGNFTRKPLPTTLDGKRMLPLTADKIDQFGKALLNAYPLPNRIARDIYNRDNYYLRTIQKFTKNNINSRMDYRLGNHSLYGTYGFQKGRITTPRSWGQDNPFYSSKEFIGNQQPDNNFYVAIGDTYVLTPSMILDVRLGVNRIVADNLVDEFDNFDYGKYGVPQVLQDMNTLVGSPPAFSPGGSLSALNSGTSLHKRERQTNSDFNGSMTWTRGRWTHKFGGTYRVLLSNYIDPDDSMQIQTDGSFTRKTVTANGGVPSGNKDDANLNGYGPASILLGAGIVRISPGYALQLALAQKYYGIFSQNDWRVNDRLTLNLGLRWDVQPGPTERYNRLSSLDFNSTDPIYGTKGEIVFPGVNRDSRNLWQTEYKNFGPRLGAAYQFSNNIVLRGGYGLSYVPSNTGFNDGPGFYAVGAFTASAPTQILNAYGSNPAGKVVAKFNDPSIIPIFSPVGADITNPALYGGARRFPYDFKSGYVQQWNFIYEQKFGGNWIASAGYLGSHGSRLQVVYAPINSAQLVDPQLLSQWRNGYINSNGSDPSTAKVNNPYTKMIGVTSGSIRNTTITAMEAAFPLPLQGDNTHLPAGVSDYHALQLTLNRQYASGLQFGAHYTWSKLLASSRFNAETNQNYNDGGTTGYLAYRRPEDFDKNRRLTTSDVPHRFSINWVYDLPIGNGKMFNLSNKVINSIAGGWRLGGWFNVQSGFIAPISGGSNALNGLPDRVPGVSLEVPKDLQRWYDGKTTVSLPSGRKITPCSGCFLKYNIDAFSTRVVSTPNGSILPDLFWYGNAASTYNELRSNANWDTNISLEKSFKVGERFNFNLSAQATNLFNHTRFRPGLTMGGGGATKISEDTVTKVVKYSSELTGTSNFGTYNRSNVYDPRQIEMVLKLRF